MFLKQWHSLLAIIIAEKEMQTFGDFLLNSDWHFCSGQYYKLHNKSFLTHLDHWSVSCIKKKWAFKINFHMKTTS